MTDEPVSSRLEGFYKRPLAERVRLAAEWADLDETEQRVLESGLSPSRADQMVENVVGVHALPLGIAVNFLVNGRDYLIPMAIAGVAFAPNTYWLFVLGLAGCYAIVGYGLSLLIGLCGQVSIGHAGFFAIGAYAAGILITRAQWSLFAALPVAMAVTLTPQPYFSRISSSLFNNSSAKARPALPNPSIAIFSSFIPSDHLPEQNSFTARIVLSTS